MTNIFNKIRDIGIKFLGLGLFMLNKLNYLKLVFYFLIKIIKSVILELYN